MQNAASQPPATADATSETVDFGRPVTVNRKLAAERDAVGRLVPVHGPTSSRTPPPDTAAANNNAVSTLFPLR